MQITTLTKTRSELILLLAAMIWGFAFVAQRVGMDFLGPFTFNGIRFFLGGIVLVPFLLARKKIYTESTTSRLNRKVWLAGVVLTGIILFAGAALQQVGLQSTTAGKAGFLTGLYVVFVPLIGLFLHHKSSVFIWIGVALAVAGLYFLTITEELNIGSGDLLVLACAVVFSFHVLMIGWLSPKLDPFFLAAVQFFICSFMNIAVALITEHICWSNIMEAAIPLAYGGFLSVGVAYTLQVVAQQKAHPAHASIILCLEAVFAVLGGWLILDEHLTGRSLFGCFLMLAGMILVQVFPDGKGKE